MRIGSRLAALVALVLAFGSAARAAPDPEVEARKQTLLGVILFEGEAVRRSRSVASLAKLDNQEAARALAECLDKLAEQQERLTADAKETREKYEPYKGFSFKDPRAWDIKKRLIAKMEQLDMALRANSIVLRSFTVAISKMRNDEGLTSLSRSVAKASLVFSRSALYGGLIRNGATPAEKLVRAGTADGSPAVRLEVLNALGDRKDVELWSYAAKALKEKGWPHRQAAARALGKLGDIRGVPPLIQALSIETGRLVEVYSEALEKLTAEKLGPYPDVWKQWYDDHKKELAAKGAKAVSAKKPKKLKGPVNYYGIKTRSKRIVFIIDISGSMKEIIGEKPKAVVTGPDDDKVKPHGPKIEVAKKTLKQAIRALQEDTFFNIIVFNHQVRVFREEMLESNQDNKNEAYLMINDLEPAGATYTYGALQETFRIAGRGASDKAYDPGVDTIFLLSDGAPTDSSIDKAKPMKGEKILDAVDEWNKLDRVQIHAIAIDPRIGSGPFIRFMKLLAKKNDGTYTEIGN